MTVLFFCHLQLQKFTTQLYVSSTHQTRVGPLSNFQSLDEIFHHDLYIELELEIFHHDLYVELKLIVILTCVDT